MPKCEVNVTFDLRDLDERTEFQRLIDHLEAVHRLEAAHRLEPVATVPGAGDNAVDPEPVKPARRARTKPPAETEPAAPEAAAAEDLSGPPSNGAVSDPIEELGFVSPSMSPAEAKDAALVLIREVYAAGKVAEVKNLQKTWGVAKFYDVPVEKAHEFYRQVLSVAVDAGLRT